MSKVNLVPLVIGFLLFAIACIALPWRVTNTQQVEVTSAGVSKLVESPGLTWAPLWEPPGSRSVISCYPDPTISLVELALCICIPLLVRRSLKRSMIQEVPEDGAA